MNPTRRAALYQRAQRILYEEAIVIPLAYPMHYTAVNKRITGFVPNAFANTQFGQIGIR